MAKDGNIEIKGVVLKPFNLERALAGDPVLTRHGKQVKKLFYFENATGYVLAGVIDGYLLIWYANGKRYDDYDYPSDYDLFMAPVKKTMYMNVYRKRDGSLCKGSLHETEEAAGEVVTAVNRIALATVTWEE